MKKLTEATSFGTKDISLPNSEKMIVTRHDKVFKYFFSIPTKQRHILFCQKTSEKPGCRVKLVFDQVLAG